MLYFLICLVVGIAAVLLAQKADIECVNTPAFQDPVLKSFALKPAAKWREDRTSRAQLAQLAQQ